MKSYKARESNFIRIIMPKISFFTILVIFALTLINCSKKEEPLLIAISKASGSEHYEKYGKWLKDYDSTIIIKDLYFINKETALGILDSCDGLVLSGGPDVHPFYYSRLEDTTLCEVDLYRDSLEFDLINKAYAKKIPILAICRGEQILNVHFGGSLYADIPTQYEKYDSNSVMHRMEDKEKAYHNVKIISNSFLNKISGVREHTVNTNHHQAVRNLSDSFVATAFAPDGIIEAYEWKSPTDKPFLIAIQWHPERLKNDNPLSNSLALEFLKESRNYKIRKVNK